ncbi:MAG: hypothetical protein CVU11_06835 [Bacteroidetes bacterium HGW-Bacteroidetes-6]|jgi:RNA polymerase sigma-70 factor (ECF subfamily)|nr:MAG: hypothetical protein CVU11_06835 [Bacteroidetes bacterium HGW-Bacteroidetes-6]
MLIATKQQTTSAHDDTPLLVKAALDDISNFGVLYDRHYNELYRFIFRRLCDTEKSFDMCSHVFLKAMENLRKFNYTGKPFIAWLYKIALNEIYMQHRKRKLEIVYHIDVESLHQLRSDTSDENQLDREAMLMQALQKLDRDEMEIVEMRYFEKQSVGFIAGVLGISENNVSVRIFRIIKKLKGIITKSSMS